MKCLQRKKSKLIIFTCFVLLVFTSLAMGKEGVVYKGPRGKKKVEGAGAEGSTNIASLVRQDKEEPYVYDPTGKPDPFKSFIAKQEAFEKKRKKRKPRTYLETVELSQLDLIATIINPKGNWAMVKDAKGVGHVIKVGTAIGTNGGVVQKIEQGKVIIREVYRDFRGKRIIKDIVKKLPSLE